MGGGLTRAAGALFTLLFLYFLFITFKRGGSRPLISTALSGMLLVLSHPEWSLNALLGAVVFWSYFGKTRAGSLWALWIVGGVFLFTSPWWGTVVARHGLAPFWAALHAPQSFHLFQAFTLGAWTGEIIPLMLILTAIGWVIALFSPFSFLSVWLLLDLIVEPRGALRTASLEMALLAAYAVFWCFAILRNSRPLSAWGRPLFNRLTAVFIILLVIFSLFNGLVIGIRLSKYHVLTAADLHGFIWIWSHAPHPPAIS